jgi:hypothetical protein
MEKLNSIIIESISEFSYIDIYLKKEKQRYYLMMIKY